MAWCLCKSCSIDWQLTYRTGQGELQGLHACLCLLAPAQGAGAGTVTGLPTVAPCCRPLPQACPRCTGRLWRSCSGRDTCGWSLPPAHWRSASTCEDGGGPWSCHGGLWMLHVLLAAQSAMLCSAWPVDSTCLPAWASSNPPLLQALPHRGVRRRPPVPQCAAVPTGKAGRPPTVGHANCWPWVLPQRLRVPLPALRSRAAPHLSVLCFAKHASRVWCSVPQVCCCSPAADDGPGGAARL